MKSLSSIHISYIHLTRQSRLLRRIEIDAAIEDPFITFRAIFSRKKRAFALPRAPKSILRGPKVGRHLDAILKNNICAFLSLLSNPALPALGFDRAGSGGEGKITVQSAKTRATSRQRFEKKFWAGCITTPAGRNEIFYSRGTLLSLPSSIRVTNSSDKLRGA